MILSMLNDINELSFDDIVDFANQAKKEGAKIVQFNAEECEANGLKGFNGLICVWSGEDQKEKIVNAIKAEYLKNALKL